MRVRVDKGKILVQFELHKSGAERVRKDQLRNLHLFRWNRGLALWEANYDPAILLQLLDIFGPTAILTDESTQGVFQKCLSAEKKRLRSRDTFLRLKNQKVIDLEGYRFDNPPFAEHQRLALTCLKHSKVMALFFDCGLGKTFSTLMWIRYLLDHTCPDIRALVVSPLNTLTAAWAEDIDKHAPDLSYVVLNRTLKDAKAKLAQRSNIVLINFEKVPRLLKELEQLSWDVIVVDESVKMANARTKTAKALHRLGDQIPHRIILSGFPAPQSELQYWSQMRFLSKRALGMSFLAFREKFFTASGYGGFSFAMTEDRREQFEDSLKAYSFRARAEDYIDLPAQLEQTLKVVLPERAMAVYEEYHADAMTEIKALRKNISSGEIQEISDTWISKNVLDQLIRLRQICGGFLMKGEPVWDEEKGGLTTETRFAKIHDAKVEAVQGLVEEIGHRPILIWANFKYEFELLKDALGDEALICNSTVSQAKKERHIKWFTETPENELKILLAHPKSVGHGLTFVNCCYNIFYSPDWSVDGFVQAKKRTHRIGQTRPVHYYYLEACSLGREPTVDTVIYEKLQGQHETSLELLDRLLELSYDNTTTGKSSH